MTQTQIPGQAAPRGRRTGSRAVAPRSATPSRTAAPTLRVERGYQRAGYRVLAGMDEVGRGALAGPVTVGVVCIDETCRSAPTGVRDSKLLTPARREALVRPVRRWALAWGVGHASPAEIDAVGIMAALRLAGRRALAAAGVVPDLVILDGNHDWLSDPARVGLLGLIDDGAPEDGEPVAEAAAVAVPMPTGPVPPVQTRIKADMSCSSVAAASVLAKVERDALMVAHAATYPQYQWEINKGYAAPGHRAALLEHGPCELHRRSWNITGGVGRAAIEADVIVSADLAAREAGEDPYAGAETEWGESVSDASGTMGHDDRLEVRVDGC